MGKTSEVRVQDPHVTELASGFREPRFVGVSEICPIVEVGKEAGVFTEYGPDASVIRDGLEQPLGSARKYIDMTVAKGDYRTVKFGVNVPLFDEEMEESADPSTWEDKKALLGASAMLLFMEKTIADYLQTPANFATGYKETLSGTAQWSDYTNSDPLGDVLRWVDKEELIHDVEADELRLAVGPEVYRHLRQHPQLKVTAANGDARNPTLEDLAAKFGVQAVRVLRGKYVTTFNRTDPTATVFARLWGKVALVYRPITEPDPDSPLFGAIARRRGYPKSKRYYNDEIDAEVIANTDKWGLAIRSNKRAYLADAVVA